jgi:hypothetical protein
MDRKHRAEMSKTANTARYLVEREDYNRLLEYLGNILTLNGAPNGK